MSNSSSSSSSSSDNNSNSGPLRGTSPLAMEEEEDEGGDTSGGILVIVDGVVDKLRPWDIICGRCGNAYHNIGNRRFRVTISLNLKRYMATKNRKEKSAVIQSIVDALLEDAKARFLKQKTNGQYEVMDVRLVRQKIQHALRDMAAFNVEGVAELDFLKIGGKVESHQDRLIRQHQQNLRKDLQRRHLEQQGCPANMLLNRGRNENEDASNNNLHNDDADDDASLLEYAPFLEDERMLLSRPGVLSPPLMRPPLTMIEQDKVIEPSHHPPQSVQESAVLLEGTDPAQTMYDDHFFSNGIDDHLLGVDDPVNFFNIHNKPKEEVCR